MALRRGDWERKVVRDIVNPEINNRVLSWSVSYPLPVKTVSVLGLSPISRDFDPHSTNSGI